MSKTIKELKKDNKEPEMRPNDSGTLYVPVNRLYFNWYWNQKRGQNQKR